MKPSEILDAVLKIDVDIANLQAQIEPIKDRLEVLGFARSDIRTLLDGGAEWPKIEERLELLAGGIIPDAPDEAEEAAVNAPRKPRSDIGKRRGPRAPKPHVAPITSPLTAELRAKLEATLSRGPMTLEALTRMSWAADVKDVEGLLCEDAETFVRWTSAANSQRTPIEVWGLIEHFDRAVGTLTLQCAKSERGKYTAEALGCSVYQALGAWKRLDPEAL